jgi:hypothetical protein
METTAAPLQTLRNSITTWEASFRKINGHKPTSLEIKENPEMYKLYQQYHELKRRNQDSAAVKKSMPEKAAIEPSIENLHDQSEVKTKKGYALSSKPLSIIERQHLWSQQREKARLMAISTSRAPLSRSNCKREDVLNIEEEIKQNEVASGQDKRCIPEKFIPRDACSPALKSKDSEIKADSYMNLSKVIIAPKRGLIFREHSRSIASDEATISPKDSIDLYCHEVLTPFDTSAMLVSPAISTPDINMAGQEHDIRTVRKHLFTEINQELSSSSRNDQITPMIKRQQVESFVSESQLMLKQSVSYSQPKVHPLQKKAQETSVAGVPVRENFVRLQVCSL